MVKRFLLDTNIILNDPKAMINGFSDNIVIISGTTLQELDKKKTVPGEIGYKARECCRILDDFRMKGDIIKGIRLKNKGVLMIEPDGVKQEYLPEGFSIQVPDNRIISTCIHLTKQNPKKPVILVTNDISMRINATACGVKVEGYRNDQVEESGYTGHRTEYLPAKAIDEIYEKKVVDFALNRVNGEERERITIFDKEFVTLKDDGVTGSNQSALTVYYDGKLHLVEKQSSYNGLQPKNAMQSYALWALSAPAEEVPLVVMNGPAGTAKTLLTLAAGLDKTYTSQQKHLKHIDGEYDRIIISRPSAGGFAEMGFLPGDMKHKLDPLLAPYYDNLKILLAGFGKEKATPEEVRLQMDYLFDEEIIEILALSFIRGRSLMNTYLICDECFVGETLVLLANGSVETIEKLTRRINNGEDIQVVSYNTDKDKFENKKILSAQCKGKKKYITVKAGNRKVRCTKNHPFLTTIGWKKAEDLHIGDGLMMTHPSTLQNLYRLNDDQKQIFIGSFLGDGGIDHIHDHSYRIKFVHSMEQQEYIEWKASMFPGTKIGHTGPNGFNMRDKYAGSTPCFYSEHNDLKRKKSGIIPEWVISDLDWRGIAIWIMDDGSYWTSKSGTKCLQISTYSFDEEYVQKLSEKLDLMGVKNSVVHSKGRTLINILKAGLPALVKNISAYVHDSMINKIGGYCECDKYEWDNKYLDAGVVVVTDIIDEEDTALVYDIEVEDNHNFIVCGNGRIQRKYKNSDKPDGIIVHNCQNASKSMIRDVITRAGTGTKVVLCGDPNQIDQPTLDRKNNGLVYAMECMKSSPMAAIIQFDAENSVRSPLARDAVQRMK